jgi:nucleoid-associated protein YgaU
MQKDLKIGMLIGMVFALAGLLWLFTRQNLSVKSRQLSVFENEQAGDKSATEPRFISNMPNTPPISKSQILKPEIKPDNSPVITATQRPEKSKSPRYHIIQRSQTLSEISNYYYGNPNFWPKIYEANKKTIKNPDKLTVGSRIIIPE